MISKIRARREASTLSGGCARGFKRLAKKRTKRSYRTSRRSVRGRLWQSWPALPYLGACPLPYNPRPYSKACSSPCSVSCHRPRCASSLSARLGRWRAVVVKVNPMAMRVEKPVLPEIVDYTHTDGRWPEPQPIETAPKHMDILAWSHHAKDWHVIIDRSGPMDDSSWFDYTHWLPLPPDPTKEPRPSEE